MPLSAGAAGPILPYFPPEQRQLGAWANQVHIGKLACNGVVTLTANATSTSVADQRAGAFSFIDFRPTTANAASAQAAGAMWASTRGKAYFVITHTNSAAVDKTFVYCILG